ncbi:MAG: tetratricopeptide repeat protein [Acidobacteriota bacterium]|nr:tetratricopeptide repeat protein [Acidobacteriota bacterium]
MIKFLMTKTAAVIAIALFALLTSSQAQTSKGAADNSESSEATRLAVQVAELYKQGKYAEALPLAKHCLQIREKLFTPKDEPLRTALINLAELNMALRKYGDAEPLFERLISSYREFAPGDPRLAAALQRLALIKFLRGNPARTEDLYRQAVDITEKIYDPEDAKVASALFHLAEFYQLMGDYKKAEPLYERVVAIREKKSPNTVSEELREALDRYSCLLYKTKRSDEANQLEARAFGWLSGKSFPTTLAPIIVGVINGKAISLPRPVYPEEARANRVQGVVTVRVVIDETGKVIRSCAIQGPALLTRTSEIAALGAVFTPTKLSGQPVKVTGVITYNFVAR